MYYNKKLNKIIEESKKEFIYEIVIYNIEKNIFSIFDNKFFSSIKFINDKTIYLKRKGKIIYIELITAPINWIINNGFEEVDPDIFIKKKFKKNKNDIKWKF